MLFSGKFCSFPEKYDISGKYFGISGKIFPYLGKNVIYPEKIFRCPFLFGKCPLKAWPPKPGPPRCILRPCEWFNPLAPLHANVCIIFMPPPDPMRT
jgi:hypothetical protein